MKTTLVLSITLLACCIYLTSAAPAPAPVPAPAPQNQQSVQFLKYTNDKELEEIQRQIIAQYETLGGTSQFHEIKTAPVVNPQAIKIAI